MTRQSTIRNQRVGILSREGRRRAGAGEAQPPCPLGRWQEEREPGARGQGPWRGWAERLHHQHRQSLAEHRHRRSANHRRESIQAHLTIVFAALAVTRLIQGPQRLVDQEVRPLPHRADPCRPADREGLSRIARPSAPCLLKTAAAAARPDVTGPGRPGCAPCSASGPDRRRRRENSTGCPRRGPD
jgi:hypothetical protein